MAREKGYEFNAHSLLIYLRPRIFDANIILAYNLKLSLNSQRYHLFNLNIYFASIMTKVYLTRVYSISLYLLISSQFHSNLNYITIFQFINCNYFFNSFIISINYYLHAVCSNIYIFF